MEPLDLSRRPPLGPEALTHPINLSGAQHIHRQVGRAFPAAVLKQSTRDVYRWEYGERECQLHEVCDDYATLIVLRREACWPKVEREPAAVEISVETEAEVARSILRWLGR